MRPQLYCVALLCVALSCASLASYVDKRPEVRIKDFDITSISFKDIDLLFDVEISNPYPISLNLEKVNFKVDIEKKQLFASTTPSGFSIKAAGTATTPLAINLQYAKIAGIVKDYRSKDYLTCDISGELTIPLPRIPGLPPTFTYPFKVTRKIPAIKPSISIANFSVKAPTVQEIQEAVKKAGRDMMSSGKVVSLLGDLLRGKKVNPRDIGLNELDLKLYVNFDIKVKNETKAKIAFDRLSYDFVINGEKVFKGDSSTTRMAGDTLIVSVTNVLSSKSLGKGVLQVFKDRRGIFDLKGETYLKLPSEIKASPLRLKIDEGGSFGM